MHRHKHHARIYSPWRSFSGLFWIIGIFFLASHNWWWPGILILVGISMIMSSVFRESGEPQPLEPVAPLQPLPTPHLPPKPTPPQPFSSEPPTSTHRNDLLPTTCPRCGGPVRPAEVTWRGAQSASCAYCGSALPLGKIK